MLRPACFNVTAPVCATFSMKSRKLPAPYSRSENVESSCSSVLLSSPSCGVTSRSDSTLSARLTIGSALEMSLVADGRPSASLGGPPAAADEILVGDELVTVLLHRHAGELPAADDDDLAAVLLQLLDQRDEVAVAADDDEGVDVIVGEGHLEGVERHRDVGAVLVAAGRHVALHHADRVLRQQAAVVADALPVAVGDLGDDLAALLDGLEHEADVELAADGGLDADLDVVEVDEDRNAVTCFC